MTGIVAQNVGRTSGLIKAASGGTSTGAWTLIKTLTACSSATLSFVDGASDVVLDSTYPIYVFKFINLHPSASASFTFNLSIDSGSNYNVTKTSSHFRAYHSEDDSGGVLAYDTGFDLAQSTAFQDVTGDSLGTDSDIGVSGTMSLFNPSSTTFVKHFQVNLNLAKGNTESKNSYTSGYGNTTSAVDAVQFKMDSGNIDSGKIKLYGLGDS